MNIYGYKPEDDNILTLEEVTLHVSIDELEKIAAFINNTLDIMKKNEDSFGHEHFNDYVKKNDKPDIIIVKR
ncbi:hypothetical protein HZU77_016125 [Neisseriaceae bacterium TC5R-5]|nr:hypothetical protein [Neisseriaceae bacterium TC5R-5]